LGHEVYGLRRNGSSRTQLTSPGIIPIFADITLPESLPRVPARFDWVVLCAASSGGGPDDYRRVYLEGSRNVVDWLAETPPKTLVYTSSTSVYGQVDGSEVDESSPTQPATSTAQILVQAEEFLIEQTRIGRMPSVVMRLAGIYGPERGYWLKQFLQREAKIEGRGDRYLNMIHRDDVIGAIRKALEVASPGQIFNVVDDEPVTQLACFEWMSTRLQRALPKAVGDVSSPLRKRGFTNKRVRNSKLKSQLEYNLKYPSFREGFEVEIRRLEDPGGLS
jgi:nucleoside-diphosphate-sugar epimerase